MVRIVISYIFAPLFAVSFMGAALALAQAGAPKWTFPLLLLCAIAVSFAAERIAPYDSAWNRDKDDSATDAVHALVNEAGVGLSLFSLPFLAEHVPHVELWPVAWPLWAQLLLAVAVSDFGITMTHYASHRFELLWRLHAVHHAASRLYGFNGLMKHPLHQSLELLAGTAPLFFVGITSDIAWLLSFAVSIQLLLQHSNVDMRIGWLAYVWAAAPVHRHHHLASKTEGDVNFGLFLTLWDHLLGTFVANRRSPREGEVGVAGRPDYPKGYLAQLFEPFRSGAAVIGKSQN
jgi:sterol desaturase/sphingolipid hydroxylase (fatty acid hydroxylase superfamily)